MISLRNGAIGIQQPRPDARDCVTKKALLNGGLVKG